MVICGLLPTYDHVLPPWVHHTRHLATSWHGHHCSRHRPAPEKCPWGSIAGTFGEVGRLEPAKVDNDRLRVGPN